MSKTIEQLAKEYASVPSDHYVKMRLRFAFMAGAAAQREQDRAELERVCALLFNVSKGHTRVTRTGGPFEVGQVKPEVLVTPETEQAREALSILTALLERGKGK